MLIHSLGQVLHAGSWELGKAHDVDDEVDLARDIVKREENLHTRSKLLIQVPPKERLPESSSLVEIILGQVMLH